VSPPSAVHRGARVCLRAVRLTVHLSWGMAQAWCLRWRLGPQWFGLARGAARRRRWLQGLGDILGLRVRVSGEPMDAPGLLVANHVSWLDIVAIAAATSTTFLAKDDVRTWPIIGRLGRWSGTIFLQRARRAALGGAIDAVVEVIARGQRVALFPEGTTSDGREVGHFHRGLFQAAVQTGAPVQAIAVRYQRAGERDTIAPFIGDDTFLDHLLRVMAEPSTEVQLDFQRPFRAERRGDLAGGTEARIRTALARKTPTLAEQTDGMPPRGTAAREPDLKASFVRRRSAPGAPE